MKLASLRNGRDGRLVVVSRDITRCTDASFLVPTLQAALDDWQRIAPHLQSLSESLEHGAVPSERFHEHEAMSPLPRAYQWAHVPARGQQAGALRGISDRFFSPRDPIIVGHAALDMRTNGGIAVIVGDVAMGSSRDEAEASIRLVMLVHDVAAGSAFSPVAVTPDELGDAWSGGGIHLPLRVGRNGKSSEQTDMDATSDFGTLIAHAAEMRPVAAGSIFGSVGALNDPSLRMGDTVRIEMKDQAGNSIFGAIEQTVRQVVAAG